MLHRISGKGMPGEGGMDPSGAMVAVGRASFPAPFVPQLEFNPPVHETWNIVHVGMLVPECHQIYVCADNCMRGVVMTADEMGLEGRFSCVLLEEEDLYEASLEDATVEGVADVIARLPYRPRAVMVFLVCLHHFVGTDLRFVYGELEARFPDIDFMRCWMDPIMQKSGLAPEQKLKEAMFRPIRPLPASPVRHPALQKAPGGREAMAPPPAAASGDGMSSMDTCREENGLALPFAAVLGDNQPLDMDSDLARALLGTGSVPAFGVRQLFDCKTYDDYLALGAASLFITRSPAGIHGVTRLARRLGRPFLYLPPVLGEKEICDSLWGLREALCRARPDAPGTSAGDADFFSWLDQQKNRAHRALEKARGLIGDTEVTVDHVATSRPLGLARLLLEQGFHVTRVYLDAVSPEEKADFDWLAGHHPRLLLCATIHPKMRVLHGQDGEGRMLAIGPKAAWFGGTRHFVNMIEFGGMWGFEGIAGLAAMMEDAFLHEKDTRALVPRKGLGCACVL